MTGVEELLQTKLAHIAASCSAAFLHIRFASICCTCDLPAYIRPLTVMPLAQFFLGVLGLGSGTSESPSMGVGASSNLELLC
jgi:hypothetical protein